MNIKPKDSNEVDHYKIAAGKKWLKKSPDHRRGFLKDLTS
jgi:hypothetical protein